MKNTQQIQNYLEKVLQSNEFAESKIHQKLFRYLFETSFKGQVPKETTVALDVFCADLKEDPECTAKVRVYIYNLRKKLDSYYLHEGAKDKIRFEIPKGHYKVVISNKKGTVEKNALTSFNWRFAFCTISLLLLLSVVFIIYLIASHKSERNNNFSYKSSPVWIDYFDNDMPILVLLGDYYFYLDDYFPDRPRLTRDYQINSEQDLNSFLDQNEQYNQYVNETGLTFLSKLAPWCLFDLLPVMLCSDSHIELKLSSQLQWADLNKYNIVYVGTFKSFGKLSQLLDKLHVTFQVRPNSLYYHPEDADTTYEYTGISSSMTSPYEIDYAVIAKIPGPNHNSIILFTSMKDIGCLATVKFLTQPKYFDAFYNKYLHNSEINYFEAVFRVKGYERTVANIELLHFTESSSHQ
jgi:hypothetical protein